MNNGKKRLGGAESDCTCHCQEEAQLQADWLHPALDKTDVAHVHLDSKQGLAAKACQAAPVPARRQTNARIPPGPG